METHIGFKEVSKSYNKGSIIALDDVSFEVGKGEFFFVIGHSGAGKSTLIRLLVRQELPTQGNIDFGEIDVTQIPRKMLSVYRQQLGIVFQDLKLIPSKTVRENIEFALEIIGKPKKEIKETTEHLLDVVDLETRAELFPNTLSGGEQQRLAIARGLASDPVLFIADEPTGNLDPKTAAGIMELLDEINSWGTTVMVVTHDVPTVKKMNKRTITMEKGAIISDQ